MSRGASAQRPSPSDVRPLRFLVVSLLLLLAFFPPETHGEAKAGAAALLLLLALLRWPALAPSGAGPISIVAALLLALPLTAAAVSPAAALEPIAIALLAGAGGLALQTTAGDGRLAAAAGRACAAAGSAVAAYGVYQRVWGLPRLARIVGADPTLPDREAILAKLESGRAFAAFSTPAALGGFLAITLPVTVALACQARGRRRAGWIALSALQAAGFWAAASATAVAALAAAALLAAVLWTRGRAVLLLALVALAAILGGVVAERAILMAPGDPAGPWRLRAGNLRSAAQMAADHPWLGVGPGSFAEAYLSYRRPGDNETRHAHNLPLELAAELGLPTAALAGGMFFVFFVGPLWTTRRRDTALGRRGIALGLASFALHNLADFTAFMPSILWTAALLRGMLARPPREAEAGSCHRPLHAVALTAVAAAGLVVALSGFAREWRVAAREAAHAGEVEAAHGLAQRAVRVAPWDVDAALALARAHLRGQPLTSLPLERREGALALADRAVRLSPLRPASRELRSQIRLSLGDAGGAFSDIEQAARLDPARAEYARAREALRLKLGGGRSGASG